ncbi:hypothetical protein BH09MYX1_BH09MYX1_54820 [soil metagenome]
MKTALRRYALGACLLCLVVVGVACGATDAGPPTTDCGPTAMSCGGQCVDLQVDAENCGGCSTACKSDELCSHGHCTVACLGGTRRCGNACVDVHYDPLNCGSCGAKCPAGRACLFGACSESCVANLVKCKGFCLDVRTDDFNCGACGTKCTTGKKCVSGTCTCAGATCDGVCTDTQTNALHCGGCGIGCIPEREACVAGQCVCAAGFTSCNGICVRLDSSPKNCGACGTTCASGALCTGSVCGPPTTAWPTQGANVSRDGVLAGETGKPPLTPSWSTKFFQTGGLQPLVVAGNHVYATFQNFSDPKNELRSLDLADGTTQWSYLLGAISRTGYPSLDGGRVYLVNGYANNVPPQAVALDGANGNLLWSSPVTAQFEQYWSPLIVGGSLYTNAGTYGGLVGMDLSQGTPLFFNSTLEQYDQWSAAWSGSAVLTFIAGKLRAHDPTTGNVSWTTTVPWTWSGYAMRTYPVVAGGRAFVVAPPSLYAVDLVTHAVVWNAAASYVDAPAVYGGSVFAIGGGGVIARDAVTGQLQWMFAGDNALEFTPVIANGYMYVASQKNTYAVDLTTHTQAWTVGVGGYLAIASRRLLIAANDTLYAFVMSP